MIIIELYDGQGLGNQLWVYVTTRYLSKKLNMPYIVLCSDRFKADNFLDIDFGEVARKEEIIKKIEKNQVHYFKEKMHLDVELFNCFMVGYDPDILNIKPYTKIDGYFQSEKYLFNDFEYMKEILPIMSPLLSENFLDKNTCILNIRGGDEYTNNVNLLLPKTYWTNALHNIRERYGINKFKIVTDDHEYAHKLFPELEIVREGIAESYIALHQARYLIVSNSSFSYFPIKTMKEKPYVIAPMHWARFNNQFKRWAGPANLYTDWCWQDYSGNLFTYKECLQNYDENISYYNTHYNILVKDDIMQNFTSFSIKKFFPKSLKVLMKKIMPYELAKKFERL